MDYLSRKKYAESSIVFGFSYCRSNAVRRKITFELTPEQYALIISTGICYYCEEKNLPPFGSKIDRLDSEKGYLEDNCVPCCEDCNYLKGKLLSPFETKSAVFALKEYHATNILPEKIAYGLYTAKVKRIRKNDNYSKVVKYANTAGIDCTLTQEDYLTLISNSCYYCGGFLSQAGYGLDRKHAQGPYSLENCIPCCPVCNRLKWDRYTTEETLVIVNAIQKIRMDLPQQQTIPPSTGIRAYTKHHVAIKEEAYHKTKNILLSANLTLVTSFEEYNLQAGRKRFVKIQCYKNHIFTRLFERAKHILECPVCTDKSNKSGGFIEKLKINGWELISGEYKNKTSILTVRCISGHEKTSQYRFLRDIPCVICRKNLL